MINQLQWIEVNLKPQLKKAVRIIFIEKCVWVIFLDIKLGQGGQGTTQNEGGAGGCQC